MRVFDSLRDFLQAGRGRLTGASRHDGAQAAGSLPAKASDPTEAPIPDPTDTPAVVSTRAARSALSRWAVENPKAFSGLWFAAAAGLLVGQALFALPVLVAQARTIGGLAAWQWGAFALAYVYVAPLLLALILGFVLGAPIIVPGFTDGWAPAARGMLVGVGSLVAWLLMGTMTLRLMPGFASASGSEAPPGAAEAAGLVLLPVPFLLVAAVGACAGFVLHTLMPRGPKEETAEARQAVEVHSRRIE